MNITPEQLRREAAAWGGQGLTVTGDYFRAYADTLEKLKIAEEALEHIRKTGNWWEQVQAEETLAAIRGKP